MPERKGAYSSWVPIVFNLEGNAKPTSALTNKWQNPRILHLHGRTDLLGIRRTILFCLARSGHRWESSDFASRWPGSLPLHARGDLGGEKNDPSRDLSPQRRQDR